MVTISIDPGYERLGIAVIQKEKGRKEELLFSECFKTSPKIKLHERIFLVGKEVEKIIEQYKPNRFAIESVFHTNNTKTVLGVAEVRGVLMFIASNHNLTISEYTPPQIKNAVTGYGKATKEQVYLMVTKLIHISKDTKQDDEIDAIAIGLTDLASARDIHK
jgi:crossover junction endodeoxyribonuclease RuvC